MDKSDLPTSCRVLNSNKLEMRETDPAGQDSVELLWADLDQFTRDGNRKINRVGGTLPGWDMRSSVTERSFSQPSTWELQA